jgi:lipid-A-disaccharide synthase
MTAEVDTSPRRLLVVAAERSADKHAAEVVRELKARLPRLRVFGLGGDALEEAGAELVANLRELSVMGFVEVLFALPRILRVKRRLLVAARWQQPEAALLVDAPDFNLRLAKALKRRGVRVVYYVAPKLWASRPGRARQLSRRVDALCTIFPFEEKFFADLGVKSLYVGNPSAQEFLKALPSGRDDAHAESPGREKGADAPLCLLPGSRRSEVKRHVPIFANVVRQIPGRWICPRAPNIERGLLQALEDLGVEILEGDSKAKVQECRAALVAAGTASLELALMDVPQAMVYVVNPLSAFIYRRILTTSHLSLVNILMGRRVVPEFWQEEATGQALAKALREIIEGEGAKNQRAAYAEIRQSLAQGNPAQMVADLVEENIRANAGGA